MTLVNVTQDHIDKSYVGYEHMADGERRNPLSMALLEQLFKDSQLIVIKKMTFAGERERYVALRYIFEYKLPIECIQLCTETQDNHSRFLVRIPTLKPYTVEVTKNDKGYHTIALAYQTKSKDK